MQHAFSSQTDRGAWPLQSVQTRSNWTVCLFPIAHPPAAAAAAGAAGAAAAKPRPTLTPVTARLCLRSRRDVPLGKGEEVPSYAGVEVTHALAFSFSQTKKLQNSCISPMPSLVNPAPAFFHNPPGGRRRRNCCCCYKQKQPPPTSPSFLYARLPTTPSTFAIGRGRHSIAVLEEVR